MLTKSLTVVNPSGLHLRPAGVLSQTAMKFKSDIIIEYGEKRIVAKSVLNVMAAGIKCGAMINVICDGEDEEEDGDLSEETRFEVVAATLVLTLSSSDSWSLPEAHERRAMAANAGASRPHTLRTISCSSCNKRMNTDCAHGPLR